MRLLRRRTRIMTMTNIQRILKALTENEDIMKALANGNEFRSGEYINRNIFNNVNLNDTLPHTDSYIYFDDLVHEGDIIHYTEKIVEEVTEVNGDGSFYTQVEPQPIFLSN